MRHVIVTFILAMMLAAPRTAMAEVVDKIEIVVNDEIITQGEIDRILAPMYERYSQKYSGADLAKNMGEVRQKVAEQLVEDRLMLSEAKRQNVEVEERDIDAKVDDLEKRLGGRDQLGRALLEQRLSMKELRNRFKEQIMIRRLIDKNIGGKVLTSPIEINEYYAKHKEDFVLPEEVELSNILIKPGLDVDARKAAALAQEISKRLKDGSDFSALAKIYSDGPGAPEGGKMGYVKRGDLMPEIENVVFNLKEGEASEVIQTSLGYHIFKVDSKRPRKERSLAEVRQEVEEAIFREKAGERMEGWLAGLKKNAYIAFK